MTPTYIHLESIRSTNTYLAQNAEGAVHGTVVYADCQTAGRGQRGNSWESADFKNITMSMLLRPANVKPSCQFWLSEAVALAVVHTLDRYIDNGVSIKWPNDIYWNDRKICGILVEHSLSGGKIDHTIAGIGLNINQEKFLSDAPNPVSLRQIIGCDTIFPKSCCALPTRCPTTPSRCTPSFSAAYTAATGCTLTATLPTGRLTISQPAKSSAPKLPTWPPTAS